MRSFIAAILIALSGNAALAAAIDDRNPVINNGKGLVVGAPTGGNLGPGTGNFGNGVFLNGVAVSGGLAVPSANLLGGTGSALTGVTVGSGLNLSGGVLTSTGGITVPSASLLGGNGTALTPITLGSNLSITGGVLNASGSGTPGGNPGQLQTNVSGTSFGGISTGTTGNSIVLQTTSGGLISPSVLPTPTASTLGGVQSAATVTHQWISAISTAGVPVQSQPAAADISGLAASATTDTTNAANISTGTIGAARLPLATTSAFGAVKPDGTTITISAGVISSSGGLSVPTAPILAGDGTSLIAGPSTGTSGHVLPFLDNAVTFSGAGTGLAVTNAATFSSGSTHGGYKFDSGGLSVVGGSVLNMQLNAATTGNVQLRNATGGLILRAFGAASASTAWLDVTAGTGGTTIIAAGGSATDRSLSFTRAGAGSFTFDSLTTMPRINTGANVAYSGAWSGTQIPFLSNSNASGSIASGITAQNYIVINADTVDISAQPQATFDALRVTHNFGGAGTNGARTGASVILTQTGTTDDGVGGHVALFSNFVSNVSDGGSVGNYKGQGWAMNSITSLGPNATYYSAAIGYEHDMAIQTGASVALKVGIASNSSALDAVQGDYVDAAFIAQRNGINTVAGWRDILSVGAAGSRFPLDPGGGGVIRAVPWTDWSVAPSATRGAMTGASLLGFKTVEWNVSPIQLAGFQVGTTGAVTIGNAVLSSVSTGLSIDVPLQKVTAAAVNGGASGLACFVGSRLYGPTSNSISGLVQTTSGVGIYNVTAANGSKQATALSVLFPDVSASPPANPLSMIGQECRNVSVNLTWTAAANVISMGASGSPTSFGSAALTLANNAIGLTKQSNTGPALAPGAGGATLYLVCGTNAGTYALAISGGTSTTPEKIKDNIGSGATGC